VHIIDKGTALEHAVWQCLVVASTDHVHGWVHATQLDHLKIMWEVSHKVNSFVDHRFVWNVEHGYGF